MRVYTSELQQITEKGFVDPEGKEQEVDVIICATSFDTTYKSRFPLVVNGIGKREEWKDRQHAPSYLSLALPKCSYSEPMVQRHMGHSYRKSFRVCVASYRKEAAREHPLLEAQGTCGLIS